VEAVGHRRHGHPPPLLQRDHRVEGQQRRSGGPDRCGRHQEGRRELVGRPLDFPSLRFAVSVEHQMAEFVRRIEPSPLG